MKRELKVHLNLSVTPDTAERLRLYAWENHTSISQAITDWIWTAKVKGSQVRGQLSMSTVQS